MTIENETNHKDDATGIETLAEPDTLVINTESVEESLYTKLNTKNEAPAYDAWCRHSD